MGRGRGRVKVMGRVRGRGRVKVKGESAAPSWGHEWGAAPPAAT